MPRRIKVWYDAEGDFLEVQFEDKPGSMRATDNDLVMERVDVDGNLIGFSVMQVSKIEKSSPLVAQLA